MPISSTTHPPSFPLSRPLLSFVTSPSPSPPGRFISVDVCSTFSFNPCSVGDCINDLKGSYTCSCPRGFVNSSRPDGTPVCAQSECTGAAMVQGSAMERIKS